MTLWAIVPVKPLRRGKSRLSQLLTVNQRAALNRAFLTHTLEVLRNTEGIEQILVVSRDPAALSLARKMGARTLQEKGDSQLNLALRRAAVLLQSYRVSTMLVLPADLPLLTVEDVREIIQRAEGNRPVVVLAPDRHREGTNALLTSPLGVVAFRYGPGSFARHLEAAREAGARIEVVERPGLAVDIDWPEDLAILQRYRPAWCPWLEPVPVPQPVSESL